MHGFGHFCKKNGLSDIEEVYCVAMAIYSIFWTFQTQKPDSILFLLHKARRKFKVETCQFSDGKTFHIRISKSSQEMVAIDYSYLFNKRKVSLIVFHYFALLLKKKFSFLPY